MAYCAARPTVCQQHFYTLWDDCLLYACAVCVRRKEEMMMCFVEKRRRVKESDAGKLSYSKPLEQH